MQYFILDGQIRFRILFLSTQVGKNQQKSSEQSEISPLFPLCVAWLWCLFDFSALRSCCPSARSRGDAAAHPGLFVTLRWTQAAHHRLRHLGGVGKKLSWLRWGRDKQSFCLFKNSIAILNMDIPLSWCQNLAKDAIRFPGSVSCSCWGTTECSETLCSTNFIQGSLTSDSRHFCH